MTINELSVVYEYVLLSNKTIFNAAFAFRNSAEQGIASSYEDAISEIKRIKKFNIYDNLYIFIIKHNLNPLDGTKFPVPVEKITANNIYDISFKYASKVVYELDKNLNVKNTLYLFKGKELAIKRLSKYLWIDNYNIGDKVKYKYKGKIFSKIKEGYITNISNKINEDIIYWDPIIEINNKQIDLDKVEYMILEEED